MRTLVAAISLSFLAVGCGQREDSAEIKEIKLQRLVRGFVEKNIKDPKSSEFRNQHGFCGEVNAKNSFGGYVGFRKFIATSESLVVIEGESGLSAEEFSELWGRFCEGSPTAANR